MLSPSSFLSGSALSPGDMPGGGFNPEGLLAPTPGLAGLRRLSSGHSPVLHASFDSNVSYSPVLSAAAAAAALPGTSQLPPQSPAASRSEAVLEATSTQAPLAQASERWGGVTVHSASDGSRQHVALGGSSATSLRIDVDATGIHIYSHSPEDPHTVHRSMHARSVAGYGAATVRSAAHHVAGRTVEQGDASSWGGDRTTTVRSERRHGAPPQEGVSLSCPGLH